MYLWDQDKKELFSKFIFTFFYYLLIGNCSFKKKNFIFHRFCIVVGNSNNNMSSLFKVLNHKNDFNYPNYVNYVVFLIYPHRDSLSYLRRSTQYNLICVWKHSLKSVQKVFLFIDLLIHKIFEWQKPRELGWPLM